MTDKIKCPICNKEINRTYYSCSYGLEEEYISCDRCHYDYEFAYGNHKEMVHNQLFVWDYTDFQLPQWFTFKKKINKAIFKAKKNWKKHKKPSKILDYTDGCLTPRKKTSKITNTTNKLDSPFDI